MKFRDLRTGDVVTLMDTRSVIVAIETPHPKDPSFLLIVWYIFGEARLSFDMLHPDYDLIHGTTVHSDGFLTWNEAMSFISTATIR